MSGQDVQVALNEGQRPSFSDRLEAYIAPRTDNEVVEVCKRVTSRQPPGFIPGESSVGKEYVEVKSKGEVYKGKVYYTNADPVMQPLERVHAQVLPLRTAERSLRRTESMSARGRGPSSSPHQQTPSAGPTPALTPSNSIRSSSTRSLPPTPAPNKPLPPLPKDRDANSKGLKLLTRLRGVRDLPRIEDLSLDAETEAELGPFLDYLAGEADPKTPVAPLPKQDANPTQDADTGSILDDLTREADDLISEYASLVTAHDASTAPVLSTDDDDDDDEVWYEELTEWEYAAGRQADADRQRDEMVRAVREAEEQRLVRERGERVRAREERVRALVEARREEMRRGREGRK